MDEENLHNRTNAKATHVATTEHSCGLLRIPLELRHMIYKEVCNIRLKLDREGNLEMKWPEDSNWAACLRKNSKYQDVEGFWTRPLPPLFQTSRLFYNEGVFILPDPITFIVYLKRKINLAIPLATLSVLKIQRLTIRCEVATFYNEVSSRQWAAEILHLMANAPNLKTLLFDFTAYNNYCRIYEEVGADTRRACRMLESLLHQWPSVSFKHRVTLRGNWLLRLSGCREMLKQFQDAEEARFERFKSGHRIADSTQ